MNLTFIYKNSFITIFSESNTYFSTHTSHTFNTTTITWAASFNFVSPKYFSS